MAIFVEGFFVDINERNVVSFGVVNVIFDIGTPFVRPDVSCCQGKGDHTLTIKTLRGGDGGQENDERVGFGVNQLGDEVIESLGLDHEPLIEGVLGKRVVTKGFDNDYVVIPGKNRREGFALVIGFMIQTIIERKNVGGAEAIIKKAKDFVWVIFFQIYSEVVKVLTE